MKSRALCAALGLCGLLAVSSQAMAANGTFCDESLRTDDPGFNPGYVNCLDPRPGVLGASNSADLVRLNDFSLGAWSRVGSSMEAGLGPFDPTSGSPIGTGNGRLVFDIPRADLFVIGLQATVGSVAEFVFYLFDHRNMAAASTIAFDTLGIDNRLERPLQVASLFVQAGANPPPPSGNVPEPAAWALMAAGCCALGAFGRRRAA